MITLDLNCRLLVDGDRRVRLTRQMCDILEALSGGKPVKRDNLIACVWPTDEPENASRIIDQQLYRLRKMFAEAGMDPIIRTVWGVGSALTCPIEVIQTDPAPVLAPKLPAPARPVAPPIGVNAIPAQAEAPMRAHVCSCGATVIPHAFERLPVLCSICRADRVEQVIAQRVRLAAD